MSLDHRGSSIRLLYVGSELVPSERLTAWLPDTEESASVCTATSAAEAVRIADEESLTAVVAERDLPDGDGLSVLSRCLDLQPELVTILVSTDNSQSLIERTYEEGVDEFVHYSSTAKDRVIEHYLDIYLGQGGATSRQPRTTKHMETLAASASDVILSIDESSTIQYVNPAVTEVFGYEPEELLGESLTILMPDEFTERHNQGMERYLSTGERTLDWDDVELPGQHKDGHRIPLSISFAEFTIEADRYFTGIIRDISERKRMEAERELYHETTQQILRAESLEAGLETAVEAIGSAMDWAYGEAWVRADDEEYLERVPETYAASASASRFTEETAAVSFEEGAGLVGRVWESETVEWMPDVTAEGAAFVRQEAATAAGLRAGLGVPIVTERGVVAVLVFFLSERRERDDRLVEATTTIAADLSRLMRRLQTETALREERSLKDHILETSPVGILIVDTDGTISYCNDNTTSILDPGVYEGPLRFADLNIDLHTVDGDETTDSTTLHHRVADASETVSAEASVTVDGERRWLSIHGAPLHDEREDDSPAVFSVQDVTARKERERRLQEYEAVMQTVTDGLYALDEDGRFVVVNDAYTDLTGHDRGELIGQPASEFVDTEIIDHAAALQREIEQSGIEDATLESTLTTATGETVPIETRLSLFELGEDTYGRVGVVRDITDRKRREQRLATLNEVGQSLTKATTPAEVAAIVVEGATETLDLPLATVEYYDEDAGHLQSGPRSPQLEALAGTDPLFDADWDLPWQVYAEHERRVISDIDTEPDIEPSETPLASVLVLPLADHGVFIAGATTADAVDETDVMIGEILSANAIAALDRVEREQQLRAEKEQAQQHNEALERVNRLNSVIRSLTRTLTEASTREEIEQSVCNQLAGVDPYTFAWIGHRRAGDDELTPAGSAGREAGYLDAVRADDQPSWGLIDSAEESRDPSVRNNLQVDPPFEPWRVEAIKRGYGAAIAVPLSYGETVYGVLSIFAEEPGIFDTMETTVLGELGEMIGYAINAIERKKALTSDRAVELTFSVDDDSIPAIQFARETGSRFEFETFLEADTDTLRVFFTVTDAEPEAVYQFTNRIDSIQRVSLLAEREDGSRYEAVVSGDGFFGTLLSYGAYPTAMVADPDGSELTVELPQSGDVRSFVRMVTDTYDGAALVARKQRDRPVQTRAEFEANYRDRLTERQEEVLQTAYFSGFFEWPRNINGTKLAEHLGISQPTVSRHIRTGQRELFSLIFDDQQSRG